MTYDEVGNQLTLTDPNAGLTRYSYDALGREESQTDSRGNTKSVKYDVLGRISKTIHNGVTTDYKYYSSGNGINKLEKIQTANNSIEYTYDDLGRQLTEKRIIDGSDQLEFSYQYDLTGSLQSISYPGQININYEYDSSGNLERIVAGTQVVWEQGAVSGTQTTAILAGGSMTSTSHFNAQGLLDNLKTVKENTVIRNFDYDFDGNTGNLRSRTGINAVLIPGESAR